MTGQIETVGAVLLDRGRVLLGRRAGHKTFAGCWDVIGGHVERGETIDAALRRELSEELGIAIEPGTYLDTIDIRGQDGSVVPLHLYAIRAWRGEPELANNEHDELRWFGLEEAATLTDLVSDRYPRVFVALIEARG